MTDPSHAIFLSYASQDAQAAQKICEAMRAAGIEVFLDQSELRGGDAWDQKIRREIQDCALFIPVISANTAARHEGYFRLEWDLADQRTHMIARSRVFIVPVCLDATTAAAADVPESFRRVQWTRLPEGETPPEFVERMKRLLSPGLPRAQSLPSTVSGAAGGVGEPTRTTGRRKPALLAFVIVLCAALAYLVAERLWISRHGTAAGNTASQTAAGPAAAQTAEPAFNPPPHSIAVLPFVNLSGDAGQQYFSDGLTEELLNSLTAINELQVAARTSSFSFKDTDIDIGTIARKLNVGAVLEGSVRRSAHTVRITAQLINAVTGFHLWSKTYDRDLGDVLQLQTEIASAVAGAMKVTLLGDVAAKVELGGTRNPAAFDAYLRGAKAFASRHGVGDVPAAIDAYTAAIDLDPHYALAFAGRSVARSTLAAEAATAAAMREAFDKAQADARQALELAPDLAQAHLASAKVSELGTLDFSQANQEFERALALAPGNAEVLRQSGLFAAVMGHFDEGVAAARRAIVLDPLARLSHSVYARALHASRRYPEAVTAFTETISLSPDYNDAYAERGLSFYMLGDLQSARASCETQRGYWGNQYCLAVTYDRLGRHADAQAEVAKMQAAIGDTGAYQYATIYAQWGNPAQALQWLDTALRVRDPGLGNLKTDPLLDPIRKEPHFQSIERSLQFPN